MPKEIVVDRRVAITSLLIVFIVLIVIFGIIFRSQYAGLTVNSPTPFIPTSTTAPTEIVLTNDEARNVAEHALVAYFTVDYSKPLVWIDSFRDFTLSTSMNLIEKNVYSIIWPKLEENKTISTATVVSSTQIAFGESGKPLSKWQIWQVTVLLDNPWPAGSPTELGPISSPWPVDLSATAYVNIIEVDGRWQFALFPSQALVNTMLGASSTNTP